MYDPYYDYGGGPPLPYMQGPMGGRQGPRQPPQPPPLIAIDSAPMDYYYTPDSYGRPGRAPGFVQMGGPPMPAVPMGPPQPPPQPQPMPMLPPWTAPPPMVERQFAGIVGAGNRGASSRVVRFDDDDELFTDSVVIKPKKSKWRAVSKKRVVPLEPEVRRDVFYAAPPAVDPGYPVPGFYVPAQGFPTPPMAAYVLRR